MLTAWVAVSMLQRVGADVSDCSHTFAGGQTFDLSGLRRPQGESDWYADDRNGNMYYFNVCGDANQVPAACVSLEKAVQAPAYQVTSTDDCFWLGKLRSSEWELIDESEPAAGLELYYFDGEQCSNGISRDFRIQLFCDPDAGVGKPLDYFVLEEDCHYSVTWPSKYGCPVSAGWWPRGNAAALLTYASTGLVVYLMAGLAYNVRQKGMEMGPEALPHASMWMSLASGMAALLVGIKEAAERAMGMSSGYSSVNSAQGAYQSY